MPPISKRRTSKNGNGEATEPSRKPLAAGSKVARSQSCRALSASTLRAALLEDTARGCKSCSSSPFSSPPSSPASSGQCSTPLRPSGTRRARATVRERNRMHRLNDAYDDLRTKVPTYPCSEKPSKIQTLRLAMEYISDLSELLNDTRHKDCAEGEDVALESSRSAHDSSTDGDSVFLSNSPQPQETYPAAERSSPSRSSSCSSTDTLNLPPTCPSVITHFITQTTGCAVSCAPSSPHSSEFTQASSSLSPAQQLRDLGDGSLSAAPRSQPSQSASYSVSVMPSFYASAQQTPISSALYGGSQGFVFRPALGELARDMWTPPPIDGGLSFTAESLLDHQLLDVFGDLSSGSDVSCLGYGVTKDDRSGFESLMLQPGSGIPVVSSGAPISYIAT